MEYRVEIYNPITKESICYRDIPAHILSNYNYDEKEEYLINIGMEIIKDDYAIKNDDFANIDDYIQEIGDIEFSTCEEIYDYIEGMPSITCNIDTKINPNTESKADNPIIKVTANSYEKQNGISADEKPIGYAGQYAYGNKFITACIFRTYTEASEADGFDRIIPVYFEKPLT